MKQFRITILFTVLMSMFGVKAFAYDIEVVNKDGVTIWYNWINDKTELAVTLQNPRGPKYNIYRYTGNVDIPESVDYNGNTYPVTYIGSDAFNDCLNLTSVNIPNSVTSIGILAFAYCSALTSITIGNSVKSIEEAAFSGCSSLTSVTIPNSVTSIGKSAFSSCSDLTSVTIPNSVTSIGRDAFENCGSLVTIVSEIKTPFEIGSIANNSVTLIVPVGTKTAYQSTAGWSSFTNIFEVGEGGSVGCRFVIDGINYTIGENNTAALTSTQKNISGAVVIPSQVEYNGKKYDVTSIGNRAFSSCSGLTSVTIPNSVTSIGKSAFSGCSGLTSVTIPNSVTSISENAFYGCSGLTSVTIPNSVTSIGDGAFYGCSGLTSVTIPNNVTSIGNSAFSGCSGLTSLTIPNNVTSIGNSAFNGCSGLTSVTIPNSVTSIGESAFRGCSYLTSVVIGSGVTSIGFYPFSNTNLKKTIWLTNTPPDGAYYAEGTINYVANEEYNIRNKVVYPFLSSYFEVDGVRYVPVSLSDKTCDAIDCTYEKNIENIQIASTVIYKGISMSVKKIQPYIGYGNKIIKSLTLSNNGDVGEYAFANCSSMETIDVNNAGSLEEYAFSNCSSMVTANISNTGAIGKYVFENCSSMVTANISNTESIGHHAFKNCSSLETANISNTGSIGDYAFASCSKLKSLKLGNSVSGIGSNTFQGCSSLESVTIPNLVETINEYTFADCLALKTVIIGSKVKVINQYAFSGCEALPTITIPQAVTDIKNYVFYNCKSLKEVIIADSESELNLGSNYSYPIFSSCPLDTVYIGRNISYSTYESYGYSPFYRNTTLRAVKITDKETEISENEFYGCTNLQRVIIGDGVTTIGNWAFSGCSSLKFFTFGSEVKTIGQEAFSDCTAVTEITSRAITPPTCGNQALDDINKWECKLYVPKGHLADYQAAEQWKEFLFVEEGDMVITPIKESITISSAKQVTYMSDKNLNFTDYPDLKAYVATGYDKASGTIWLTRVKEVPANTGFLLMGDAGDYEIPVKKGDPTSYYMNLFKGTIEGTTIQTTEGDYTNYYLSNGDAGVGFYKVQGSVTLKANRAYLSVPTEIPTVGISGSTETIKVSSAGQVPYYNSQSLDFSSLDAQGVKAYTATGYDYSTGTIWLTRVKQVPAETGILIMAPQGEYPVPTASVASVYANMFKGTLTGTTIQTHETIAGEDYINYYLSSGDAGVGFYKVTKEGGVTIGANRCYLPIKNKEATAGTRSAGSGQSQIAFQESDEVIGIPLFRGVEDDNDGTTNLTPALSKGEGEGDWYTLQGQRVAKPGKGLYIRNGRKVVIK